MPRDKSYDEFILGLYAALLKDCAVQYPGLAGEFDRDYKRLRSSLEHHGIYFFLDTMPAYRKHFDRCLDERRLTITPLLNFGSWRRNSGMVPRLFRGLFLRVFELTGELRNQPDCEAVRWIRQLLGAVRKLRHVSKTRDICECVDEFYQVDEEVENGNPLYWDSTLSATQIYSENCPSFDEVGNHFVRGSGKVRDICQQDTADKTTSSCVTSFSTQLCAIGALIQQVADIIASVLGVFDPYEWKAKHGPGSVSDQQFGSNKYSFSSWPDRLETVFPYADFAFANHGIWADRQAIGESPDAFQDDEHPAKLFAVPKTLRKPRLIASEPTSLQWCQQIVRDFFYSRVRRTVVGRFVDFTRQDLNGRLALAASHARSHMTIDLSSASDRVSCYHVERLFRRSPSVLDALRATRSKTIKQDICGTSPSLHQVRKYSTMGNATTFPVQSLLFLSIALGCTLYVRGQKATLRNLKRLGENTVRVFGDDIIVPSDASRCTVETLKAFSMKVNDSKTFGGYGFRESCGVDAYDGYDVTTVNILEVPRKAGPGSIVSSVDVHHNLLDKGMAHTAEYIRQTVEQCGYDNIRTVEHRSGLFGWSDLGDHVPATLKSRWNCDLSRREVRCLNPTTKVCRMTTVESSGLLQFFTEAAKKVTSAVSTLGYLARRPKVTLGLRWVPIR